MTKHTKPAIAAKITNPRVFTINGEDVTAIPGHYLVTYDDGELMLLNEDEFKARFIRIPGAKNDEVLAIEDVNGYFRDNPNGLVNGQDTTDKNGKPLTAEASEETVEGLRTVREILGSDHESAMAGDAARADASLKVKEAREKALIPKATAEAEGKAAPAKEAGEAKSTPADKEVTGFGTSTDRSDNGSAAANTVVKTTEAKVKDVPVAKSSDSAKN